MKRIEKTVFISYRRTNIFMARAIFDDLTTHGFDVFFDYMSIDSGDFSQNILQSIESRVHFLLILTPSALERCREPQDWLRREIEHALKHNRNIVPLTFEGFDFEDINRYLPDHISNRLSAYNGLRIPADYFAEAMDRLRHHFLSIPIDVVLHPANPLTQSFEKQIKQDQLSQPQVTESELATEELFERGLQDQTSGYLDAAIKNYTAAILLKPDYINAYNNRAFAYATLGDHKAAIRDYSEAIRLDPTYTLAFLNRGRAYYELNQYERAIQDYNTAIQLQPDSTDTYYNRAVTLYHLQNYDAAMVDFEQAIQLNSGFAIAYLYKGKTHYSRGELHDSLVNYNMALRLDSTLTEAYYSRALVHGELGNTDREIEDYERVLRLDRNHSMAKENLQKARNDF